MALTQDGRYTPRQAQILVINSILVFLSVSAVVLRFWARKIQRVRLYLDDYLIAVALLLALGVNAILYQSLHVGVGQHEHGLSVETVEAYALNLYVMQLVWNTTLPTIKLSILVFLKRIFPVRSMVVTCSATMAFLCAWYIAFQTVAIFQCRPIHHAWTKTTTEGTCIAFVTFVTCLATTNLATDVFLLVLPVRQIWKLQMRVSKRIGLSITFAVGTLICVISVVRLAALATISDEDITWSDTYAHLWTAIESSLGVVVACLPHLMPVYNKCVGRKDGTGSYVTRPSNPPTWVNSHTDSFSRGSRFGYAATDHSIISAGPHREQESSDDLDLIPKHMIGVRREIKVGYSKHADAYPLGDV